MYTKKELINQYLIPRAGEIPITRNKCEYYTKDQCDPIYTKTTLLRMGYRLKNDAKCSGSKHFRYGKSIWANLYLMSEADLIKKEGMKR